MTDSGRQFSWRQGHVLSSDAALALGLCNPDNADTTFVVVISHDCDLAAAAEKEPASEVIVGRRIERLGRDSYGKTARRLHIEYQTHAGPLFLELASTAKQAIEKAHLFKFAPRDDISLDGRGIGILQRWLAARYHRAAFPESFEARLRAAPGPGRLTLLNKIEAILDDGGDYIRALLFDLDEGENIERTTANDLHQLGIIVLYDSSQDEPTAAAAATIAAEALEDLFEAAFHSRSNEWQNLRLLYCDAVSDSAITVAQMEMLKQWRLEHLSLQDDPSGPLITI